MEAPQWNSMQVLDIFLHRETQRIHIETQGIKE
jgi:hypothetical protein